MHDFHGTFRDLLHAANLRHGTHGFTSLPKEKNMLHKIIKIKCVNLKKVDLKFLQAEIL